MSKVFSKEKWLIGAKAQIGASSLTQEAIDHALTTWVEKLDGKPIEEIDDESVANRAEWFVEV